VTPEELAGRFTDRFADQVTNEISYGVLTAEVPATDWPDALLFARDELGCTFFDWLTGVDELDAGFAVVCHLWSVEQRHHVLLRTRAPREHPQVPTATGVFAGASWHERETFEMFGVVFDGHPHLVPLLLPDGFEGHPLRKEFVLAARVAKPWPGAKEPGESDRDTGAPSRRRMLPPGVPDPAEWGPDAAPPPPEREMPSGSAG